MNVVMDIEDGRFIVNSPKSYYEELRPIPGSTYESMKDRFSFPMTWSTCILLRGTFGNKLEISDAVNLWAKDYKDNVIKPALELRSPEIDWDSLEVPEYPEEGVSLRPYQRASALFMETVRYAVNGDDMRVGKTAPSVRALRHRHEMFERGETPLEVFPILVLCPNKVKRVWRENFETFWPGVDVIAPKSGLAAAEKAIKSEPQVLILSYEVLPMLSRLEGYGAEPLLKCKDCDPREDNKIQPTRCHVHLKALNHTKWKSVIADEVHRVSGTGVLTRAYWYVRRDANYRFGLTGTFPEEVDRAWSVLHGIDPVSWPSKTKMRDRFAITAMNFHSGFPEAVGWRSDKKEEFDKIWHPMFIRRTKEVVYPYYSEPQFDYVDAEMTPKQAKAYKDLAKKMVAEIDGGTFWVENAAEKTQRLRQLASAYGEIDEDDNLKLVEPSGKLDTLMETLAELGDQQVVIFADQRQLIELAYARLEKNAVRYVGGMSDTATEMAEDAFKSGQARYFCGTVATGGLGLDLSVADTLIFLQEPWDRENYRQGLDRIFEEGVPKYIISIRTPGTIDFHVSDVLHKKNVKFEDLVNDKEFLRRALKS